MHFLNERSSGLEQSPPFRWQIIVEAVAGQPPMGILQHGGSPTRPAKPGLVNPLPSLAQVGAIPAGRESP
jgi:hypothetical protein